MSGQRIEKTPKGEHKKGRKGAVLAGVAAAVVLCGYLGLCAWAGGRDAILPHVSISGLDVSGMTQDQAADALKNALAEVRQKGYGIVLPDKTEISLDEPELIRHGSKYGVKIHAQAPSINLIKARIETEIAPIVGNEQQAKDLIAYIKDGEATEEGVWDTNIFGKSVEQIVEDGMQAKIAQMTEDCQMKLQDTLQKIINDSNGGMICIII